MERRYATVTGSSGFIGSKLVIELRKNGMTVVGIDKDSGIDIADRKALIRFVRGADYVFHMAVLPMNPSSNNIRACIDTNVLGTLNVVEAAEYVGVKKFIYSSASAVYGNTDSFFAVDETCPCNPNTMYGVSKLLGEMIVRQSKVPHVILRYMNVYGSGQKNGLIPTLLTCVKNRTPPTVFGGGSQVFDFVHVDDVVRANLLAAESNVINDTFNIGGGNAISVLDVVEMVLKASKSDMKPVHLPDGTGTRRVGSSAKARTVLGYIPSTDFAKKIKEMVNDNS